MVSESERRERDRIAIRNGVRGYLPPEPVPEDTVSEDSDTLQIRQGLIAVQNAHAHEYAARLPSFDRYPATRKQLIINHGIDLLESSFAFAARALAVQNLTSAYLWIPEILEYIPPLTTIQIVNMVERVEKLSFQWHSAAFTPGGVAPVAGQFATVSVYDEWVPPDTAGQAASSGAAQTAALATVTSVADSAAVQTLLAANAARKGASIYNDSPQTLFVKLGAAATLADFTVALLGNTAGVGGYYELPIGAALSPNGPTLYQGIITGIWAADSTGAAKVTELT